MYKQGNHRIHFTPFLDRDGVKRVWVCTIYDEQSTLFYRGISILSPNDTCNENMGRQIAYNYAARLAARRSINTIVTELAWKSITMLDPLELARLTEMYFIQNSNNLFMLGTGPVVVPHAYCVGLHQLTENERKSLYREPKQFELPVVQFKSEPCERRCV